MTTANVLAFLARFGLVVLFFPFSAFDKLFGFSHAVDQAQTIFKLRALATSVIGLGLCIEIFMSLGVVTGIADRACALVLAGYCVATAILFKRFWAPGDFWLAFDGTGRTLFWDFLKNCSLGAGFLLIVIGTDGSGWHAFTERPFASSHPYSSAERAP